jgi:type II secretory pathway component PulM
MKAWFLGLQERERIAVLGGAAAVVVIVIFAFVLRPLERGSAVLRDAVSTDRALLLDLARLDAGGATRASRSADGQTLMVLITNTAADQGLSFPRTRQDGPDAMNVTFQNASFDSLLKWLVSLETNHGVVVDTASVSSGRDPGLVSGQIFLRRN